MSIHCPPEIRRLLLRLDLFRGLDETELGLLLAQAELIECAAGDYAIREGQQDRHLFVLLSGTARIYKRALGVQKELHHLTPGECFGEMSLIDCRSRSASVKATAACKMLRLDGDSLTVLPAIAIKLYRNIAILLSQRLRDANDLLTLG